MNPLDTKDNVVNNMVENDGTENDTVEKATLLLVDDDQDF